jgi:hypothetical protein
VGIVQEIAADHVLKIAVVRQCLLFHLTVTLPDS